MSDDPEDYGAIEMLWGLLAAIVIAAIFGMGGYYLTQSLQSFVDESQDFKEN